MVFSCNFIASLGFLYLRGVKVGMDISKAYAELKEFSAEQLKEVDDITSKHRGRPGALIPVLEKVQEVLGYLPAGVLMKVAKGLNIPIANVYGVVTFYSFFTMVPKGRHNIRVCFGTACYVRGMQRILDKLTNLLGIKSGGCTEDRCFSLETVRCLGVCGLAPVIVIDEDTHGLVKIAKVEEILDQYS
jgi:NADH:ubiquinone oxidoreductase subunit E